ncbi:hypothetical protein ACJMK2_007933 [Sinanodonta woodiana]|uniref:MULE transposase domain-containing protein n=1 Tax=Sinanodonta woodiana TaxID=1069815 RepID=A0ABD3VK03_SINWO
MQISENIELGSDDEKALTKAIEHVFPSARQYLCTKHLKDNIKFYLQNKVEIDKVESDKVMRSLFGSKSIMEANTTIKFENRLDKLEQLIKEKFDSFEQYYVNNLKPRLQKFVFKPNSRSNEKNTRSTTHSIHQQYFKNFY